MAGMTGSEEKYGRAVEFIKEFMRYVLVGGTAFIVDTGVLFLFKTFVFGSMGAMGILIATAFGFIAGLIYNYILSIMFVFKKADGKVKGRQMQAFIIFAIIGIIGLGLTEGGMYLGVIVFGTAYYLVIKIFVAAVVLIWNYLARKLLIFK